MDVFRMVAKLASIEARSWARGRRPLRRSKSQLESEYGPGGDLERLRRVEELPHHFAVAGYVRHYCPGGALLDVGCGEGALQRVLDRSAYKTYLGLDLSETAIAKASAGRDAATVFRQADVSQCELDGPFDAIIFNELLQYFDDPAPLVRRYLQKLAPDGVVVVSLHMSPDNMRIWSMIEGALSPTAEVMLANRLGGWIIKVYRPAAERRSSSAAHG